MLNALDIEANLVWFTRKLRNQIVIFVDDEVEKSITGFRRAFLLSYFNLPVNFEKCYIESSHNVNVRQKLHLYTCKTYLRFECFHKTEKNCKAARDVTFFEKYFSEHNHD